MSSTIARRDKTRVTSQQLPPEKTTVLTEIARNKICSLFLAPFAQLFLTFTVIPVLMAIGFSFTYFNMLQPPQWVGIHNYVRLFLEDEIFLVSVKNTLIYAAITGPVSYLMCFLFAWLINEFKPKVRALLTLVFYSPSIAGNAYIIWQLIFHGEPYGYVNAFLLYWGF